MRFVAAIVSFVLAFTLIGLGIAQATVFAGPDRLVAQGTVSEKAPLTIVDSEALHSFEGRQRLEVGGTGEVIGAYGRTADVMAWVGDAAHNVLVLKESEQGPKLEAEYVKGTETEVPSALGSDLWVEEFQGTGPLFFTSSVPAGYSLLLMSDGIQPAPQSVTISWPLDSRTPWAGPLIAAGVFLLLVGVGLYLWAFFHWRKQRGPRRKSDSGQRMPKQPRYSARKAAKAMRPGVPGASTPPNRGRRPGRARSVVTATITAGALALTGCSADNWPQFGGAPEPSASASVDAQPSTTALKDVAVTESQVERIMANIAEVAAAADAAVDPALIEERFEGPALATRVANYTMRASDPAQPMPRPVAAEPIEIVLPQQTDAWPRVALVVVQDPANPELAPTAYLLTQESPRQNYKVTYAIALQATDFPDLAASTVGAVRYSPDNKFLTLAPEAVANAYSDILLNGAASEHAERFDLASDTFLAVAGPDARAARASAVSGPVALQTSLAHGAEDRIALATDDTGALLAMELTDTETVTPTEARATIDASPTVKLMTGLTETQKGMFVTYGYQLLFYVPPAGSDEKIRILGATEGVITAGELP